MRLFSFFVSRALSGILLERQNPTINLLLPRQTTITFSTTFAADSQITLAYKLASQILFILPLAEYSHKLPKF